MAQIKARIRAEVFNALDDQTEARPKLSNENVLINELIREYLEFNNYKYSASVLQAGKMCVILAGYQAITISCVLTTRDFRIDISC